MFNFRDSDLIKYINNVSNKPPTIYFLLESIVNYGKDEKTKIKDFQKVLFLCSNLSFFIF